MKTRFSVLLLLVSSLVAAQSVHLTVPALDSAGNAVAVGKAYVSWGQFKDNTGIIVQSGQITRTFSNGTLDFTLTASDNAGYVYTLLLMNGSTPNTFKWRVPAAGATTMAQLNEPVPGAPGAGITSLTGDVSASGPGSAVAALASVNGAPGACGDATHSCAITTDGKGRVTAQAAAAITATVAPAGANRAVQYNASGATGGDSSFTWNSSARTLSLVPFEHNLGTTPALSFDNVTGEGAFWQQAWRNNEAGLADFGLALSHILPSNGATRMDNVLSFGFNRGAAGKQVSNDHAFFFDIENTFTTPALIPQIEFYFDYQNAANTVDYRPFSITPHLNDDTITVGTFANATLFGSVDDSNIWLTLASDSSTGQMLFSGNSWLNFVGTQQDVVRVLGQSVISKGERTGQIELGASFTEYNFGKYSDVLSSDLQLSVGEISGGGTRGLRWNHTALRWEFQNNTLAWNGFGSMLTLDSSTAGSCSAGIRGKFQYTAGGAGVKDIVQVCAKDASDAYAWRPIY